MNPIELAESLGRSVASVLCPGPKYFHIDINPSWIQLLEDIATKGEPVDYTHHLDSDHCVYIYSGPGALYVDSPGEFSNSHVSYSKNPKGYDEAWTQIWILKPGIDVGIMIRKKLHTKKNST
jgi:hypothetical protein